MSFSSSPDDGAVKDSKGQEERNIARVDSSDMATSVIEVDAAYLASKPSSQFYRGVLFQMILL